MQTKFQSPPRNPSFSCFSNKKKSGERRTKKPQWLELRLRRPPSRFTSATCRENVRDSTLQMTSMNTCSLNLEPELYHGAFLFLALKWWWRKKNTTESWGSDKRQRKVLQLPNFLLECKNTRMREKDELLKTLIRQTSQLLLSLCSASNRQELVLCQISARFKKRSWQKWRHLRSLKNQQNLSHSNSTSQNPQLTFGYTWTRQIKISTQRWRPAFAHTVLAPLAWIETSMLSSLPPPRNTRLTLP